MAARRAHSTAGGPEDTFQKRVISYAETRGWTVMHVRKVRVRSGAWVTPTSQPGWPDLTLLRPGRMVLLELKASGKRSTSTDEQKRIVNLAASVPGVEAYVVTPDEEDAVKALLDRGGVARSG